MSGYLIHHGIDGQKWGVQNGPPYPLDKETHDMVVEKSQYYPLSQAELKRYAPSLSNKEIEAALKRIELERKIDSLEPTRYEEVKNWLKEIAAVVGTVSAATLAIGAVGGYLKDPKTMFVKPKK